MVHLTSVTKWYWCTGYATGAGFAMFPIQLGLDLRFTLAEEEFFFLSCASITELRLDPRYSIDF